METIQTLQPKTISTDSILQGVPAWEIIADVEKLVETHPTWQLSTIHVHMSHMQADILKELDAGKTGTENLLNAIQTATYSNQLNGFESKPVGIHLFDVQGDETQLELFCIYIVSQEPQPALVTDVPELMQLGAPKPLIRTSMYTIDLQRSLTCAGKRPDFGGYSSEGETWTYNKIALLDVETTTSPYEPHLWLHEIMSQTLDMDCVADTELFCVTVNPKTVHGMLTRETFDERYHNWALERLRETSEDLDESANLYRYLSSTLAEKMPMLEALNTAERFAYEFNEQ